MAMITKTPKTLFKKLTFSLYSTTTTPTTSLTPPPCTPTFTPTETTTTTTTTKPNIPKFEPNPEADLIANILVSHHNPFHAMESCLELHGISLTPLLTHQTLLRLYHLSKIALAFFHYSNTAPNSPSPLDAAAFSIIVDILGKVRQFDVAWQVILSMDGCGVKPGNDVFLIMVRRLVAAGFTRLAVQAFEDMPGFTETEATEGDCVYVMDTLCKYGYARDAMDLFHKWRKHGVEFGVKGYTVLMAGWCKVKRVEIAERLLKEMEGRGVEVNVVCYNVLLDGICRKSKLSGDMRFEGIIRAADDLFDEMRQKGIEPDVTSYSIVLHVCSRAFKPDLCLDRLAMMKDKGIDPSIASYTSVINCLTLCGRMDEAERLLDEMVSNGVTPTAMTYNCFFKVWRGKKAAEKALELYRRMKKEGMCVPSLHTYNILVQMFVGLNKMEIVEEVWNDMKQAGAGPDLDTYTSLVHGLIEKEKWKEACLYFMQMIEKGFLPQKVTFEMLYKGLIRADKFHTWRRLKTRLDEESISFGSEFEHYHLKPYRR